MRQFDFVRYFKALAAKPQFRRDLLLGAVSVALGLALASYWIGEKKPEVPAGPPVPSVSGQASGPLTSEPAEPPHANETAPAEAPEAAHLPEAPKAEEPAVKEGGLPAWRRYAAIPETTPREPMVAIVLDDMGPNRKGTERAMKLPATVTFAFLPYAPNVAELVRAARDKGHEILVHVPMEPVGSADPGPHALRRAQSPEEIRANLEWNLKQFEGYVGINNHMGSRFTANAEGMRIVMEELKPRGLMFLDSRTIGGSEGGNAARAVGVPALTRNIFLDHDEEGAEVTAELGKLEKMARERGYAIAIGHPHPETLQILEKWIPEAEARGISIVPLTAILRRHEAS